MARYILDTDTCSYMYGRRGSRRGRRLRASNKTYTSTGRTVPKKSTPASSFLTGFFHKGSRPEAERRFCAFRLLPALPY